MAKYCNHPSILIMKEKPKSGSVFNFNQITKEDVMKDVKDGDSSKVS